MIMKDNFCEFTYYIILAHRNFCHRSYDKILVHCLWIGPWGPADKRKNENDQQDKRKHNLDQIDKCIEYLHGRSPLHQLINIVLHTQ